MVEVLILKKRKDFVRVAKGLKMVTSSLILQAAQSLSTPWREIPDDSCFLGFTVTKKVGKAHIRNRTKRRLRAAAREVFNQYGRPLTDYVLIGRYNTADVEYTKLVNDMKMAVKRINKLFNPKPEQPQEKSAHETAADSTD